MSRLKHSIIEMLHTFWEVIYELWIPILSIGLFLAVSCWISIGLISTLIMTIAGLISVFISLVIVYIVSSIILFREDSNNEIIEG